MKNRIRLHDGIVGAVILVGAFLGYFIDPRWIWLPIIIGGLMVQSAFTGFCPVYYLIQKTYPSKEQT